jgi:tRNA-dihydrouridine synthase 1
MVKLLAKELKIPVTCKIRILPDDRDTLKLCKDLEEAGCSLLCVHGRMKEQNKTLMGECEWEIIKLIKQQANIPVFANGGIYTKADVDRCIAETGVDGVMSSEALLENPALFSGEIPDLDDIAQEYLNIFKENNHSGHRRCLKPHFFKFLHEGMRTHTDIRSKLGQSKTIEDFQNVLDLMKERRKNTSKEDKFGWYFRHRNYKKSQNPNKTELPERIKLSDLPENEQDLKEEAVET